MDDYELSPFTFTTTHLLSDVIRDYHESMQGQSVELAATQYMRLELLGEFEEHRKDKTLEWNTKC